MERWNPANFVSVSTPGISDAHRIWEPLFYINNSDYKTLAYGQWRIKHKYYQESSEESWDVALSTNQKFPQKNKQSLIKMFKLIGQMVLWRLHMLDTAELCHRLTLTQPIHWMALVFRPRRLMYYTHLFIGFTIITLLDNSKMTETEGKALQVSSWAGGEGQHIRSSWIFVCSILPLFPHPCPQLGCNITSRTSN